MTAHTRTTHHRRTLRLLAGGRGPDYALEWAARKLAERDKRIERLKERLESREVKR